MTDPTCLPFAFPSIRGKKLTAAFDGGRLTSDGGVMLLAQAARRLGIAEKLAAVIPDRRDPSRIVHPLPEILLARILAIACGYEDADDLDHLRADPAFKLACGRLPESGADLMSQPTVSRMGEHPRPARPDPARAGAGRRVLRQLRRTAPPRSPWTSTTPATWCTASSSCRCSTPTTTRAAFCRSTSTIPPPAVPSR